MNLKRKVILLAILVVLVAATVTVLPMYPGAISFYDRFIFYPFQSGRLLVLGIIPVSIGDIIYVLAGAMLLVTLIRWGYYMYRFGARKDRLAASVLNMANTVLFVYLFFIIGWGANYYKRPLREYWGLGKKPIGMNAAQRRAKDSTSMVAFNAFLVQRLNTCAQYYQPLTFDQINDRAKAYYRTYTDSKVKMHGLGIKPTLFGFFMERLAVDGYYNPFTGEGQVVGHTPAFMLPFVISHEMAHQAGIAAEDDANLMAYSLGTTTNDPVFNYSAYLSIWLYANNRLYRRDSGLARSFERQLNKLTTAHLDTLEEISKKYNNQAAHYSNELYDSYLKMQRQEDGIRSYANVATIAWLLEQKRQAGAKRTITVP